MIADGCLAGNRIGEKKILFFAIQNISDRSPQSDDEGTC
jgi:hypothetical protein